eukprot:NODE_248_length_2034_cov_103.154660_g214_i0.p1 GENE.NODE_248_length_2034_cov_103.154660_g214_i0~~NODE_248_length_2034_cov_103.154660_g214_i0.p1  ORF type:complete len:476 (-),score=100.03 NODE_248_length_2034_cov_103.154660_g214_i0:121-1548(-)
MSVSTVRLIFSVAHTDADIKAVGEIVMRAYSDMFVDKVEWTINRHPLIANDCRPGLASDYVKQNNININLPKPDPQNFRPVDIYSLPSGPSDSAVVKDIKAAHVQLKACTNPGPAPSYKEWRSVLVTGATGFIGRHVVAQLLEKTELQVYCVVRGESDSHASSRLQKAMEEASLSPATSNLQVFCGDLSKDRFGMGGSYSTIEKVDAVFHLAISGTLAQYSEHQASVQGTTNLLKFVMSRPKWMVAFTSMTPLLRHEGRFRHSTGRYITSCSQPNISSIDSKDGYSLAHAATELLVDWASKELGMPAVIFRLGEVWAASKTGYSPKNHYFTQFLQTCVASKEYPDHSSLCEFTPVDLAALSCLEKLNAVATEKSYKSIVINVTCPQALAQSQLAERLSAMGHPMRAVSPKVFLDHAKKSRSKEFCQWMEYRNKQFAADVQFRVPVMPVIVDKEQGCQWPAPSALLAAGLKFAQSH